MDLSRRDFLGATATAAVASLPPHRAESARRGPRLQRTVGTADDPLGVRKDVPALRDYTFLNTAYPGLISQAVVAAARREEPERRHDMKALAALAHSHGAYLYSDAVQFVGTGPVDLRAENVDFCTAGTYTWLMAGFGVAAFYIRRELLDTIHPSHVGWRSRPAGPGANRSEEQKSAKKFEYAPVR